MSDCLHPQSRVTESRRHEGVIYRRRVCEHCCKVYVTVETAPEGLKMPTAVSGGARLKTRRALPVLEKTQFQGWTTQRKNAPEGAFDETVD